MRTEQLEAWVLSIVDRVSSGHPFEDSRVELKASWPKPAQAARRIAGHANASQGDSVLWIIGLDESKGPVPFTPIDMAEWSSKLAAEFDGLPPECTDLYVPVGEGGVIAILFDTSRRPYVVKNPVHGTPNGGPVALEVPWRAGTATRSARREDLIRMLVPLAELPFVEVLSARASTEMKAAVDPAWGSNPTSVQRSDHLEWEFLIVLYVTPQTSDVVVLPTHRACLDFAIGTDIGIRTTTIKFHTPLINSIHGSVRDSHTIVTTRSEAVISGPGRFEVICAYYESVRQVRSGEPLYVKLSIKPASQDRPIELSLTLPFIEKSGDYTRLWYWGQE